MGNNFSEQDKKKVIEFLNLIADKADFSNLKMTDIIKIYGALAYMQQTLLPKIEDNILEIVQVVDAEDSEPSSEE